MTPKQIDVLQFVKDNGPTCVSDIDVDNPNQTVQGLLKQELLAKTGVPKAALAAREGQRGRKPTYAVKTTRQGTAALKRALKDAA